MTSPAKIPTFVILSMVNVAVDCPPITGSLMDIHVCEGGLPKDLMVTSFMPRVDGGSSSSRGQRNSGCMVTGCLDLE